MPDSRDKLRVLYVEDEPLPRWTGGKLLESLGAHVLTAESCGQAEELWHGNALDLVVCDFRLGDGLATELVERMRRDGRKEPVVCLTGEAEDLTEHDRIRLGLLAVLRKPVDAEALSALLDGERSRTGSAVAPAAAPAPVHGPVGLVEAERAPAWVSPVWGLRAAAGEGAGHWVVAPGAAGDVWVAAFGCVDVYEHEAVAAWRLRDLIRNLARSLPASAYAGDMLARAGAALALGVDPDHDWSLDILHVHADGVSGASSGFAGLTVWVAADEGGWQPYRWDQPEGRLWPARRVLAAAPGAGAPDALWDALAAGAVEEIGGAARGGPLALGFWSRSPSRLLAWREPAREGAALADSLDRLEEALELDGVSPLTARQACCGLLDLAEWGTAGRLQVGWQRAGRVEAVLEGAPPPPRDFARFFSSIQTDTERSVLAVEPEAAAESLPAGAVQAERRVRAWSGPGPERVGRFAVASLPRLVTESAATELAARHRGDLWLALDCSRVRQVGSRALAVWSAMAAERRLPGPGVQGQAGRLCLTNYSGLMGRLFRRLRLHQDMDLAAAGEELDAAGRRLTTASERASLLGSIVGGTES